MQAEVINTGTELLLGLVQNKHLAHLAGELAPLGIKVARQVCVPDGPAVGAALDDALGRAEIVIITGGLGPTSDDLTRDAAAQLLRRPLQLDQKILEDIRERFARRGLLMAENVSRQAMVPLGAEVLPNTHGTAPGLYFPPATLGPRRTQHLFLLPGPPRELHPMVRDSVLPKLRLTLPQTEDKECRIYRLTGIGESQVEAQIGQKLDARVDLEVGYCARPSEVDFRLIGSPAVLDEVEPSILGQLGEWIYSRGIPLENTVAALLQEKSLTLATGESCTGGSLANRITNVPGASAIFHAGYVTYANEAKRSSLEVPSDLLTLHGAVSEPVAAAMAEGARRAAASDCALSTTGIAGPSGGSKNKPVGTVFIGLARKGTPTIVRCCHFPVDRPTFKYMVTSAALDLLRRHLLDLPLNLGAGASLPRLG